MSECQHEKVACVACGEPMTAIGPRLRWSGLYENIDAPPAGAYVSIDERYLYPASRFADAGIPLHTQTTAGQMRRLNRAMSVLVGRIGLAGRDVASSVRQLFGHRD